MCIYACGSLTDNHKRFSSICIDTSEPGSTTGMLSIMLCLLCVCVYVHMYVHVTSTYCICGYVSIMYLQTYHCPNADC